jgi:hypothetical protein
MPPLRDLWQFIADRLNDDEQAILEIVDSRTSYAYDNDHRFQVIFPPGEPKGPAMLVGCERLLADIRGKRVILEQHTPIVGGPLGEIGCTVCHRHQIGRQWMQEYPGWCHTLLHLSRAWTSHPAYDSRWLAAVERADNQRRRFGSLKGVAA